MISRFTLIFWLAVTPTLVFGQDGVLDPTFGDGGFVETDINGNLDLGYAIVQQADGKLIAAGTTIDLNLSTFSAALVRYLPNGDLDTSFGTNGIVIVDYSSGFDAYHEVFVRPDGTIIVHGSKDPETVPNFIAGFLSNGSVDTNFGINGLLEINTHSIIKVLIDNKILIARANNSIVTLTRLLPNGAIDNSFGDNGNSTITVPFNNFQLKNIKLLDNGKVALFAIKETDSLVILMQFLPDGSLDISFGISGITSYNFTGSQNQIEAYFDIAPNGSIVIAGTLGNCESVSQSFLMRLSANGFLDESFGNAGVVLTPEIDHIPIGVIAQSNNRIIVGQNFQDCIDGFYFKMNRYHSDGSIDGSFVPTNSSKNGSSLLLQSDGKILTVTRSQFWQNDGDFFIARYNNNPLGVDENPLQTASIYPNPSSGTFALELPNLTKSTRYSVLDISGKIIKTGWLNDVSTTLDISEVQSGLYFLKVDSTTLRLIKE
jgi:uncharacterized delta-60 repeat protein